MAAPDQPRPQGPAAVDCDVLVCGLGPVGLLLLTLLQQAGVCCVGVDAAGAPYGLPRAATIDDEVLRILQSVGLDAAVLRHAQVQDAASYVTAAGRRIEVLRAHERPLGHPPLVSIHQPSLEAAMLGALTTNADVDVRWGVRLNGFDQHDGHVTARLQRTGAGPPQTLTARYLVGCDGATSAVRALLGIPFTGATFAQRWLVVDALVDRPLRRVPHPLFVGDAERPIVTLPMSPERHRWEWMLHPGEHAGPFLEPAAIGARMAPWLDGEHATVERAMVYTFHARTAQRWRERRVLLAGDAAHVMPPFAGQGFSSGARDAGNLAWKLAGVLRGAPDSLLDSYEAERRPHATAMQRLAVRWGGVVQTSRPRAARARDRLLSRIDGTRLHLLAVAHGSPCRPTGGAPSPSPRPGGHRVARSGPCFRSRPSTASGWTTTCPQGGPPSRTTRPSPTCSAGAPSRSSSRLSRSRG